MMLLRINQRHLLRERHLADLRSSMVRDASSHCRTHWQYHRWSWHLHKSVRCITSRNEHRGGMLPVASKVRRGQRSMSIYLRWKKPVDQESTRIPSREESDLRGSRRPSWMAGIMTIQIPHHLVGSSSSYVWPRALTRSRKPRKGQMFNSSPYQILKRNSTCPEHYGGQVRPGSLVISAAQQQTMGILSPIGGLMTRDRRSLELCCSESRKPRNSGQRSSHGQCEWRHL